MTGYYVIAQPDGEGFHLLAVDQGVLAFVNKHDAEDYSDTLDEPGEFVVIGYVEDMGPCVVIT